MLPAIAPVLAHMAEDAWEHLPWSQPRRSVFEAGWFQAPTEWHQMPEVRQWSAVRHSLLEVGSMPPAMGSMPPAKLHEACPLHWILYRPFTGLLTTEQPRPGCCNIQGPNQAPPAAVPMQRPPDAPAQPAG